MGYEEKGRPRWGDKSETRCRFRPRETPRELTGASAKLRKDPSDNQIICPTALPVTSLQENQQEEASGRRFLLRPGEGRRPWEKKTEHRS